MIIHSFAIRQLDLSKISNMPISLRIFLIHTSITVLQITALQIIVHYCVLCIFIANLLFFPATMFNVKFLNMWFNR
jgi:hypothetical protein